MSHLGHVLHHHQRPMSLPQVLRCHRYPSVDSEDVSAKQHLTSPQLYEWLGPTFWDCHSLLQFSDSDNTGFSPDAQICDAWVHTKYMFIMHCKFVVYTSTATKQSNWVAHRTALNATFLHALPSTRVPPIVACVFPDRYGNASSTRLLCCGVSWDV